jgi:uncharacterized protein (AIM24 family)
VAFAGPYPGKIIPVEPKDQAILCQRDAFPCAVGEVAIDVALTRRLGVGLIGGEGIILEKRRGTGTAFMHTGGTPAPTASGAGETLQVDTGCLVAFDSTIACDIQSAGGIETALVGGEGLFFASVTGPGRVGLQTLPFSRLADRVHAADKADVAEIKRDLGGMLGGWGSLIGGDR